MTRRAHRRNPVTRQDAQFVAAIALVAGILAALAGAHPTGNSAFDFILVVGSVAACVWAAATAPWWAITIVATISTAFAPHLDLIALGWISLALCVMIGANRFNWAWLRAGVVGICAQILIRLEITSHFGESAAIAIATMTFVLVIGAWRRPSKIRRRARIVALGVGGFMILAVLGFAISAISARTTLKTGSDQARSGLSLLTKGDVAGARAAFQSAELSFANAADDLGKPWAKGARLVPALAQNSRSAEDLAGAAAKATKSIDLALSQLNFDSVKLVDGGIDINAVKALEQPLIQLQQVVTDLNATSNAAKSKWLVGPVQKALRDLTNDLDKQQSRGDDALRAIRLAPQLLGANGKRVYFIAFCTPAEARGSLGFMGNFAELTVDNGKLSITKFGRTGDLNTQGANPGWKVTGPPDLLANYGWLGFTTGPDGTTASDIWSTVTMDRDFPNTAQAIAQLYPQSSGRSIDGVFALDPAALASLLQITGPVTVPDRAEPLTADNAEKYLLLDQYVENANPERIDALESIAQQATEKLLKGPLPTPTDLAKIFGPLARDHHLAAWSANADEQALFQQFGATYAVPNLNGGDGVGLSFENASASKIDTFLKASLAYNRQRDPATGHVTATATVTLTNSAPSSGLPPYVIGNRVGAPLGTNRTYLTFYSALTASKITIDENEYTFHTGTENGWNLYSGFIQVPPGGTVTINFTLASKSPISSATPLFLRPALPNESMFALQAS